MTRRTSADGPPGIGLPGPEGLGQLVCLSCVQRAVIARRIAEDRGEPPVREAVIVLDPTAPDRFACRCGALAPSAPDDAEPLPPWPGSTKARRVRARSAADPVEGAITRRTTRPSGRTASPQIPPEQEEPHP
jgi:hypothetical protein